MNIIPGVGIDQLKYGITEDELISDMGKPDSIDIEEYIEGAGDWHRTLSYFDKNIYFTFDEEDDYRLGTISVKGTGYHLMGKELFGLPLKLVKRFISKATYEIPKLDDFTIREDETYKCLDHDGLGILFWFKNDYLVEMQCGYLFESDNETIIWP